MKPSERIINIETNRVRDGRLSPYGARSVSLLFLIQQGSDPEIDAMINFLAASDGYWEGLDHMDVDPTPESHGFYGDSGIF